MDNSCYRSMYEGLREEYDKLYNAFKEAEKLNGELTEKNNKMAEALNKMAKALKDKQANINGLDKITQGLRESVKKLHDVLDDKDALLDCYRTVIKDVFKL